MVNNKSVKRSLHVKKGDLVQIISGKDKGKKGKIILVNASASKVVVEKINMVKKHQKPTDANPQGGIIEKESPINASNVMIICPSCNRPVRIKKRTLDDGKKVRVCVKCGEIL